MIWVKHLGSYLAELNKSQWQLSMETKESETSGWIKKIFLGIICNSKRLYITGAHKEGTGEINDGISTQNRTGKQ